MEKMPDRYICNLCGYIVNEFHEICPACQDGKSMVYKQDYGRKPKTKKSLTTDSFFQKKFGQMR